ncbi:hypothetical protein QBZ16_002385 [Prototheca wickerhamii]|uniref:Uncharacterized protein n=1 Tax=Prototheca wickerhamii TaxID=3111 RepID=A0AAD9IMC9_PROWI|nr:hypothetical protein QBZ16_002385 [Prototheca wickerhamii]
MASPSVAEHLVEHYGLVGKRCLVTGGSMGIGGAIVEEYAALGARNAEKLEELVSSCKAKGWDVSGVVADVSTSQDVLVNNVGTNIRKAPEEYSREDFQKLIAVNLESAFSLSQMALGPLRAAGGGAIILISSVAGGPTAMFSGAIYAMTKAAMNQLVKNLACDWAKYGIRTVAVAPWYTETPLVGGLLENKELVSNIIARTPMKRIAQPVEIARVAAFAASPAAGYLTGQTIRVDGGYSAMGLYF